MSFDLTTVADKNTPMPGGTGNFIAFDPPALSESNVALRGHGSSGQHGSYLFDGSTLSRVADLNTAIPNGVGTFTSVGGPALSASNVALLGFGDSGQQGIYLFDGSELSRVVDRNTAIPDGTGNFTGFAGIRRSGTNLAFHAFGASGQQGIYLFDGSALRRVADLNTAIPGGVGNFTNLTIGFSARFVLSAGNVAFLGVGSSGQQGIYFFDGSTLSRVADLGTAIPDSTGNFFAFGELRLSGENVAFHAAGSSAAAQQGIYLFNGSTLSRVADLNTAIPDGTGNFDSFIGPDISGANVSLVGFGNSGQQGIYLFDGSTLSRVADRNTAIPGGVGTFTSVGGPALSGGNVAFSGEGSSGQQGIYLFDGSTLARVADLGSAIPDGTGNFSGVGGAVVNGARVAFFGFGSSFQSGIYLATPSTGLTALGPARFWVGLRNSDDVGAAFDLKVELYKNDTLVASGLTRCIRGLARNPASAREIEVPFEPFAPVPLAAGDVLSLTILTRMGTNADNTRCTGTGASHASARGLRLYYDAATRGSQFDATIGGDSQDVFLHSNGGPCTSLQSVGATQRSLDGTASNATSAKCKDSGVVHFARGNRWAVMASWSMAPVAP